MESKEEVIRKALEGAVSLDQLKGKKNLFESESEWSDLDRILSTTEKWETPFEEDDLSNSWDNILYKTLPKKAIQRKLIWQPLAAAVSIILMAGYFIFSYDSGITFESGVGEIKEVSLPDGSSVVLNAMSSISYNEDWQEERKVQLSGKARFNVTEGTTFEVVTGDYVTTVLGTSFDVSYDDNAVEVSCYSGSVEVTNGNQRKMLTIGERAFVENGELVETEFNIDASQKWVAGEFYFDNTHFEKVVTELSRQFDLNVVGLPVDTRLYKGYFYKDNLIEALDLVFKPMGYDYRLEGRKVVIK